MKKSLFSLASAFAAVVTGINKYSEIGNVSTVKMESEIQ